MTNRCFIYAAFLCILGLSGYSQNRTSVDEVRLWNRAVSLVDRNSDWTPGFMKMETRELTVKGELKNAFTMQYRLYSGEDGDVQSDLISFVQNGEDITEERRDSSGNENSERSPMAAFSETPFHPDAQDDVVFEWTGSRELIDGRNCLGFTFEFRNTEGDLITGTTWLDEQSGAPLKLVYHPDKLPRFVETMDSTIYYTLTENEDWYAEKVVVQGAGGFLFIRRKFTMEMEFSDYWRVNAES